MSCLPAFLRKPQAKSTDSPIEIDYRPELLEIKQGRAGKYVKMAEIVASAYHGGGKRTDIWARNRCWDLPYSQRDDSALSMSDSELYPTDETWAEPSVGASTMKKNCFGMKG